jgi:hypothetical protein
MVAKVAARPASSVVTVPIMNLATWDGGSHDARDGQWEETLLVFLSELEQYVAKFGQRGIRDWPPAAVQHGLEVVQFVAQFTQERIGDQPSTNRYLNEAKAAKLRAESAAAALASVKPGRFGALAGLLGNKPKLSPEIRESCFWVLRALPADLERYFLALGCGFASGRTAAKWVETCGVFLSHLKRVVTAIEKA